MCPFGQKVAFHWIGKMAIGCRFWYLFRSILFGAGDIDARIGANSPARGQTASLFEREAGETPAFPVTADR
jgi:hypothetical protein